MKLTEFHNFITEVANGLPEKESKELIEIRDSLEELGPKEWSISIAKYADRLLLDDIGDSQKNSLLLAEAENVGSIELKSRFVFLTILVIILVVYYV
jgi:hypothetical protein